MKIVFFLFPVICSSFLIRGQNSLEFFTGAFAQNITFHLTDQTEVYFGDGIENTLKLNVGLSYVKSIDSHSNIVGSFSFNERSIKYSEFIIKGGANEDFFNVLCQKLYFLDLFVGYMHDFFPKKRTSLHLKIGPIISLKTTDYYLVDNLLNGNEEQLSSHLVNVSSSYFGLQLMFPVSFKLGKSIKRDKNILVSPFFRTYWNNEDAKFNYLNVGINCVYQFAIGF